MEKSSPILALLKDNSVDFTAEELEKIISTELEKTEDKRDTELVELCRERIENKSEEPVSKAKKSFSRRLIILTITVLVLAFAFVTAFLLTENSSLTLI